MPESLGVTYYSRFHFTILGMFVFELCYYELFDVAELSIQHRNLSAQSFERLNTFSAWAITYLIYLPWVFIGNLGLKSYGEWAQKKV